MVNTNAQFGMLIQARTAEPGLNGMFNAMFITTQGQVIEGACPNLVG